VDGGGDLQVWNYSTELLTSRNGVAGVVFRLSLKNPEYEARKKKKKKKSLPQNLPTASGPHVPSFPMEAVVFPRRKVARA